MYWEFLCLKFFLATSNSSLATAVNVGAALAANILKTRDPRFTTSIRGLRPRGQPEAVQIVPDDLVTGMTVCVFLRMNQKDHGR